MARKKEVDSGHKIETHVVSTNCSTQKVVALKMHILRAYTVQ